MVCNKVLCILPETLQPQSLGRQLVGGVGPAVRGAESVLILLELLKLLLYPKHLASPGREWLNQ